MGGSPATLIARWPSANPQSAIPLLGRALTANPSRPGISSGRRAVQIRCLRLPASEQNGKEGRNLYIIRALDGASEKVSIVVEDPAREGTARDRKGKGKAAQQDGEDELMIVEPEGAAGTDYAHGRWTFSSVALPPGAAASPGPASVFDTFIQRTLFSAPPPGAPSGQVGSGFWQPRAAALAIEGFNFSVGGVAAAPGDWDVKIGSVLVKGGTASGTTKGVVIEVTYLPVPYLPAGSPYVKDFLLSLFPPAAVRNGEIEILEVGEEVFQGAGLLDQPDREKGEEEGEWGWQEKHSAFTYIHQFKKEGII
ncbi:hypothetical protein JCM10213_007641 [Rhodosporidiobolus nylandii]